MKIVSYRHGGVDSFGAVKGDGIVDLRQYCEHSSLKELIGADGMPLVRERLAEASVDVKLADCILLPVIPDPDKIICVGLNYREHVAESGFKVQEKPTLFSRYPASQVGHDQPILKPAESEMLDYEGEMAMVIGKGGRRIPEAEAMNHVVGYSCYNDASVRDWQKHTTQFLPGKNFEATGAFGPWLVTSDEIADPEKLMLRTRLNGVEVQCASTADMIVPMAAQIAYISTFITLVPGDVIVTGTPGGVGLRRDPPLFIFPGDVVEVEIDQIGILRNRIMSE
jgi:2-keto-4-pentenoate hydratase/2-oxohepta-3-ene-1,7-dioic acid hydratase in catechol pathway